MSALALFVLGVFAYDHDAPFALYHLALFTDGLDRRPYFHFFYLHFAGSLSCGVWRFLIGSSRAIDFRRAVFPICFSM
jgi:hypothetical protein